MQACQSTALKRKVIVTFNSSAAPQPASQPSDANQVKGFFVTQSYHVPKTRAKQPLLIGSQSLQNMQNAPSGNSSVPVSGQKTIGLSRTAQVRDASLPGSHHSLNTSHASRNAHQSPGSSQQPQFVQPPLVQ